MNHIESLRAMVRGTYDLQKVRQQIGLRLVANFRARMRPEGSTEVASDEEMGDDALKVIDVLKASHRTLTEGVARNRKLPAEAGFKGDDIISNYAELVLVDQFLTLAAHEAAQFRQMESVLNHIPIYTEWLAEQIGVGSAMAAVLITYLDPAKARHVSSFWKYAGLDVGSDGRGRSRRQEHLVEREYTDKNGKPAHRMGVTYNPFLKTKLMGVLGGSFQRAGAPRKDGSDSANPKPRSPYLKAYQDYKHRLETDPARIKLTVTQWKKANTAGDDMTNLWPPGRIHTASTRYAVKLFLADLWAKWRALEGLPVTKPYHEAIQGHVHGADGAGVPLQMAAAMPSDPQQAE